MPGGNGDRPDEDGRALMIQTLYIEQNLAAHPRVLEIRRRFPEATHIYCDNYTAVFNRKSQNFRLQKKRPALILAAKHQQRLLPVPAAYGLGAPRNYYFSHMLNCLYDCRYCFLQGMFRSAHYVLFVNYEDFAADMAAAVQAHGDDVVHFFSGYDCDSLALDPVTHFTDYFPPLFEKYPRAMLELRTKSTQIRSLLDRSPLPNCVIAFSFTPAPAAAALEHRVPALERRIEAMAALQRQGWPIGLRFDPLLYAADFREHYTRLFRSIFSVINPDTVHSVTLGGLRMPSDYFNRMVKLYPDEPLFTAGLKEVSDTSAGRRKMTAYAPDIETTLLEYCKAHLADWIPHGKIYHCDTVCR